VISHVGPVAAHWPRTISNFTNVLNI
jgi:hypothetical protein